MGTSYGRTRRRRSLPVISASMPNPAERTFSERKSSSGMSLKHVSRSEMYELNNMFAAVVTPLFPMTYQNE